MSEPLVSIVIPTWQRHELLLETLEEIAKQTYRPKEVVTVSEGRDKELENYFEELNKLGEDTDFDSVFTSLGCNYSGYRPKSFGIAPLTVGYLMASGKYVMPWCDDERASLDHIKKLVDLIETTGVDFVYPKVRIWRNGEPNGPETAIIGTKPPVENQITHYLFRRECLWLYGMPDWDSHPMDWHLVDKWMKQGATYEMLNEVTFSHRLDQ